MKELLLPFGLENAPVLPIEAAATLAEHFNARATATFYPRVPDPVIVDPMSPGVVSYEGVGEELEAQKAQAREAYEKRLGDAAKDFPGGGISLDVNSLSSWHQVAQLSRIYDMTLVPRSASFPDWQMVFEATLFEGGRPVMLIPDNWSGKCGEQVAIGWNRSTETARLVGQTLDVMRAAKVVHVIEVPGWHTAGPDGAGLARYLERHGIDAKLHMAPESPNGAGYQVLEQCGELGADLLLKGAYTQSRLTQMIFGGATKQILQEAQLPVVFAH